MKKDKPSPNPIQTSEKAAKEVASTIAGTAKKDESDDLAEKIEKLEVGNPNPESPAKDVEEKL